jgi:hypothetical protein
MNLKYTIMIDPKEKDQSPQTSQSESSNSQQEESNETNWSENQQIDEEGAEIAPDDVK